MLVTNLLPMFFLHVPLFEHLRLENSSKRTMPNLKSSVHVWGFVHYQVTLSEEGGDFHVIWRLSGGDLSFSLAEFLENWNFPWAFHHEKWAFH